MKVKDFVMTTRPINGIEINSVGIIKATSSKSAQVYFIGKSKNIISPFNALCPINVEETGDDHTYKICNTCHVRKLTEEFSKNQRSMKGKIRRRPTCKNCRKEIDGKKIKPSEKHRLEKKRQPDKDIFNCPICKKETVIDVTAKIVADHDHKTGKGRDWICDSCNTGLGRFKDDIIILKAAIEYLRHFEDDESEDSASIRQISLGL